MCKEITVGDFKITKDTARVYVIRFKNVLIARKKENLLSEEERNTLKSYFHCQNPIEVTNEEILKAIDLLERNISGK